MGLTAGARFSAGVRDFSLFHIVQTGSGAQSYPMRIGALSPGVERPGREADHSHPSSAVVKNDEAIRLPRTSSWSGD
jgi:hypothetical protein